MNTKPKVFVRFIPGASGNFICHLIQTMFQNTEQLIDYSGHIFPNKNIKHHTYHKVYDKNQFGHTADFDKYTSSFVKEDTLEESINYFKKTLLFFDTTSELYTLPTHAGNPVAMMMASHNTKLINIVVNKEDYEQVSYNHASKFTIPYKEKSKNVFNRYISVLKYLHPEKNNSVNLLNPNFDEKMIFWLHKFTHKHLFDNHNNFNLLGYDYLNIDFSSIQSRELIFKLDDIANYIGLPLSEDKRIECIQLIEKYASAQKPPSELFNQLTIDDY